MEEALQDIWTTEEHQAIGIAVLGSAESESERVPYQCDLQLGNRTLSGAYKDRTADEVWKEMQGQKMQEEQQIQLQEQRHEKRGGHGRAGEMTLEAFLVKAGIIRDDTEVFPTTNSSPVAAFGTEFTAGGLATQAKVESSAHNQQKLDWYDYHVQEQQQQQQFLLQHQAVVAATIADPNGGMLLGGNVLEAPSDIRSDLAPGNAAINLSLSPCLAGPMGDMFLGGNVLEAPLDIRPGLAPGNATSNFSLSPCLATCDTATKRRCFEVVERTAERRQRRMIKNRESAARSRARKQAYTTELEMEVMQLKEENLRLKQQQVTQAQAPTQELKEPIRALRRTRSLSL